MSDVIAELAKEASDKAMEIVQLKAENDRLRELVRDMWYHSYCSIAKTRKDDERHVEDVMKRMRELRMEVDG